MCFCAMILGKHLEALLQMFQDFIMFAREFKEVIGNPVDFAVSPEAKECHREVRT